MADSWWRFSPQADEAAARALLYRLGAERFTDRVLLAWARAPQGAADQAGANSRLCRDAGRAPAFPLKAADFIARGIAKGPALGAAMRAAEAAWMAADFPQARAAIEAIADAAAARAKD